MGYITLDRKLFGHYFWTERRPYSKFEAWLDLIQLVSYKNNNKQLISGQLIKWNRGQFPVSRSFLAERFTWSENKVRGFIKLLEKDQMIVLNSVGKITILTLCNYESYNVISPDERPSQRPGDSPDERPIDHQMKAGSKTRIKEGKEDNTGKEEELSLTQLINLFEIFRVHFPGTKKGFHVEFDNFKKKNPKDWKEIVLILSDKIFYQMAARNEKSQKGDFVPPWKNLATWINQKCWTEEISISDETNETNKRYGNKGGATDQEVANIIAREFAIDATI
jgi:hypothetical protein